MRIGVLTGGGDCPGLNAVIRAIVRKATLDEDTEVFGFYDAWDGVMEQRGVVLNDASVRGTLPRGGTILGTRIEALVVIGGNGSLTVGSILSEQHGLPIVGVPKTIDNDVVGTDTTFGFNTAVQIATDAIDRLHTTAESHDRVMVVEVMGRDAGWIALHAGIAGGATAILVPEVPFDVNKLSDVVAHRHDRGRYASVVVVAEGAKPLSELGDNELVLPERQQDLYGRERLGDIAHVIAPAISARTGYDSRVVQLGYVQRGGTPTSYDRVLATRFGLAAVDAVRDRAFGQMVVLRGDRIERESMSVTAGKIRTIDLAQFEDVANTFFG
jgi:6-phosphofructokinase 1